MWHIKNSNCDNTKKIKLWQLKNSNCDKTEILKCDNSKVKLWLNPTCKKTTKIKLLQISKTQIVTKSKNSNCEKLWKNCVDGRSTPKFPSFCIFVSDWVTEWLSGLVTECLSDCMTLLCQCTLPHWTKLWCSFL